jgi:hypothetical protein
MTQDLGAFEDLVKAGADVNQSNCWREKPLDIARKGHNLAIVKYFRRSVLSKF